jgi:hypothetical protein
VGGNDIGFAGDAKLFKDISSGFHRGPVRVAAHQDADDWLGVLAFVHHEWLSGSRGGIAALTLV